MPLTCSRGSTCAPLARRSSQGLAFLMDARHELRLVVERGHHHVSALPAIGVVLVVPHLDRSSVVLRVHLTHAPEPRCPTTPHA